MPNFMIAYYGGDQPASKEEGMAQMEKWKAWVEGLGDAVVVLSGLGGVRHRGRLTQGTLAQPGDRPRPDSCDGGGDEPLPYMAAGLPLLAR